MVRDGVEILDLNLDLDLDLQALVSGEICCSYGMQR